VCINLFIRKKIVRAKEPLFKDKIKNKKRDTSLPIPPLLRIVGSVPGRLILIVVVLVLHATQVTGAVGKEAGVAVFAAAIVRELFAQ
jgi:hypothetical protein